jgi:hypothetical protein
VRESPFVARVRDVDEDASAVAGAGVASRRAAVREAAQDLDAHRDDLVGGGAAKISDEAEPARVAFEGGVVEALRGGEGHGRREYAVG